MEWGSGLVEWSGDVVVESEGIYNPSGSLQKIHLGIAFLIYTYLLSYNYIMYIFQNIGVDRV